MHTKHPISSMKSAKISHNVAHENCIANSHPYAYIDFPPEIASFSRNFLHKYPIATGCTYERSNFPLKIGSFPHNLSRY